MPWWVSALMGFMWLGLAVIVPIIYGEGHYYSMIDSISTFIGYGLGLVSFVLAVALAIRSWYIKQYEVSTDDE